MPKKIKPVEPVPETLSATPFGSTDSYRMLTARAASRAITSKEIIDCSIIKTFAQRDRTGTSVGEKAVEVLNARNR